MRILAYEFTTGGGLSAQPLPASLAAEGDMMLHALAADLAAISGIELCVARDRRLPAPLVYHSLSRPRPGEAPLTHYARALTDADAVWPIAPETDGILARLTRIAAAAGKRVIGCRLDAIDIAASKSRTARALAAAGIPAVPTYKALSRIPAAAGYWVVKPDDGAGCVGTLRLEGSAAARRWLAARSGKGFVAQPWIEGDALSLSLLCREGEALLLCCNRQHLRLEDGLILLTGISVNVATSQRARLTELAHGIARALPGLWGYVGVDVIARPAGPLVVEINPRLTTSYCGLRQALGVNPAALVLSLLTLAPLPPRGAPRCAPQSTRAVDIELASHHVG